LTAVLGQISRARPDSTHRPSDQLAAHRSLTLYPVEIFGNRDHQDPRSPNRMIVTVWACVLLLGFAVAHSSALPNNAVLASKASVPLCRGKAKRVRPAHVSFSFECGNEDVTAFRVQANRALHFVYDPNSAFDCLRRTSKSFSCGDIHSGAS
jgi:hypothetical protein